MGELEEALLEEAVQHQAAQEALAPQTGAPPLMATEATTAPQVMSGRDAHAQGARLVRQGRRSITMAKISLNTRAVRVGITWARHVGIAVGGTTMQRG